MIASKSSVKKERTNPTGKAIKVKVRMSKHASVAPSLGSMASSAKSALSSALKTQAGRTAAGSIAGATAGGLGAGITTTRREGETQEDFSRRRRSRALMGATAGGVLGGGAGFLSGRKKAPIGTPDQAGGYTYQGSGPKKTGAPPSWPPPPPEPTPGGKGGYSRTYQPPNVNAPSQGPTPNVNAPPQGVWEKRDQRARSAAKVLADAGPEVPLSQAEINASKTPVGRFMSSVGGRVRNVGSGITSAANRARETIQSSRLNPRGPSVYI